VRVFTFLDPLRWDEQDLEIFQRNTTRLPDSDIIDGVLVGYASQTSMS
jgi:hypothetical protein